MNTVQVVPFSPKTEHLCYARVLILALELAQCGENGVEASGGGAFLIESVKTSPILVFRFSRICTSNHARNTYDPPHFDFPVALIPLPADFLPDDCPSRLQCGENGVEASGGGANAGFDSRSCAI